jgi:hypothetical protein
VAEVEELARALYRNAAKNRRMVMKHAVARLVGKITAWHLAFPTMRL